VAGAVGNAPGRIGKKGDIYGADFHGYAPVAGCPDELLKRCFIFNLALTIH